MINSTVKKQAASRGHKNHMNSKSHSIVDPIVQLRTVAASAFFGEPMYYQPESNTTDRSFVEKTHTPHRHAQYLDQIMNTELTIPEWHSHSPAKLMEVAIDEALDFDPEATLKEAVRLRREENIRTTPQVIMVRAANHEKVRGTGLIRQYAKGILARTDEAAVQLAYQIQVYGKPIPNALKKAWKGFLETRDKLQIAKYRMENRAFKTLDVVNLVHAKGEIIDQLMKGTLKLDETDSWEAMISKNGSTKENWEKAIDSMGHMALLRNIRNFIEKGVSEDLYVKKLVDTAAKGKQLPFRYYNAHIQVKGIASARILDAIEECLELSLGHLPQFKGRVISLADNSGSAQGNHNSKMGSVKTSTIGNLMAVITGKVADDGYIGIFGDKLEILPVRDRDSILSQVENADNVGRGIGMGTENGVWLFFDEAIREKKHYDHIFVYSDMQAGHGGLYGRNVSEYSEYIFPNANSYGSERYIDVPKLVNKYRKDVNPNVMVYLVQIAGYKDTLVPEFYDRTYILGGWSDKLLHFANEMNQNRNGQGNGL
jgi:hypothetical protein